MPQTARGPFEVKLSPQQDTVGDPSIGRLALDKVFHGDLEATSKGQMLAVRSGVPGSAGYVAMERVEGTLHGRQRELRAAAQRHHGSRRPGTGHLRGARLGHRRARGPGGNRLHPHRRGWFAQLRLHLLDPGALSRRARVSCPGRPWWLSLRGASPNAERPALPSHAGGSPHGNAAQSQPRRSCTGTRSRGSSSARSESA